MTSGRCAARATRVFAAVAAAGVLSATGAVSATAAEPTVSGAVSKPISFSCDMPLIGVKKVNAVVTVTFPDSGKVGQVIQATDFKVDAKLDGDTSQALRLIGAATVEGTAAADVDVKINDTELGVTLNGLTIPAVKVADSGESALTITGPIPGLTVKSPGQVSFAIGAKFTSKVTPKRADGTETGLGTFPMGCTLNAGQDPSLATIPVTA
ncbi:DUF6801 domain-containing protein [Amycolatopsis sp. CA-230715]|uniref:DUF6801 domain-containing protein n=1 Tax=Amycolatopsis sp. CA-230715 TaxID=2745196 RepID=UPI001C030D15|nr:DUF6801 domain-containing protein [Amycolatopsis sp. CA-230715]QWF83748.1 hypothetical protein HUW46_07191 [Amycolatopsis sp. CA-230715]